MRECQTREWRNYETAWNKEKSRKGKKEIKEAAARCRHLDHGTHFASLISRKDSVRVTGFSGCRGSWGPEAPLRSLTVWYLNSKTRASQPTPFLSFLIVLVSLAAFPNVFPSFLILPSKRTSAPPPPLPTFFLLPLVRRQYHPPATPRSLVPRRLSQ